MSNLHIMRFPRWEDVRTCQRTVMHVPVRAVPTPIYRPGDVVIAINSENPRQTALLRVSSLSVGALLQFIGKVEVTGLNKELMAVGVTWDAYKKSWASTYHHAPEAETNVVRVEFGYEPLPLGKEVLRVLEDYRQLYEDCAVQNKLGLVQLVLAAARKSK